MPDTGSGLNAAQYLEKLGQNSDSRPRDMLEKEGALQNAIVNSANFGAGLCAGQLSRPFQPFNWLVNEESAEEGTELMGGRIGADSAVGIGSLFWIEFALTRALPSLLHPVDYDVPLAQAITAQSPLSTLLYVEDNPANLGLVEQLIRRRTDLRLLTAPNGEIGIEFARAYQPELILINVNLPGISGIEAMKTLHADPSTAHIPIIALSASAIARDIQKGLDAGFISYITKPIKVVEFMAALDDALAAAKSATSPIAKADQA